MRFLHPEGWPTPEGYSQGVISDGYPIQIAGQLGQTPEGEFRSDFAGQVEQALRNIVAVLAEAGARPRHLIRMDWYLTDIADFHANVDQFLPVYGEIIGAHFPAMTMVQVGALITPEALVEIDASAVLPRDERAVTEPHYYDQQYDTRLAVPEIYAYVAEAARNSAEVRAKLECQIDLSYGEREGEKLDFFPTREKDAPLLVFVHGGYWQALDKSQHSEVAPALVEAGVNVAVLDYPLLPDVTLEELVSSVQRAAVWLWRQSSSLGFDRDRIYAAGQSAGGHLTAMLLATQWATFGDELPASLVRGGLCINGLHDFEPLTKAPFIKDVLRLSAADVPRLSPARLAPNPGVRFLTAVGGLEPYEFHWQSQLLAERWPGAFAANIPAPERNHVDVVRGLGEPKSEMFKRVLELISGS